MEKPETIAIIVAAGRGARAGAGGPKQYRVLGQRAVIAWTAEAFLTHTDIDAVRIIIHRDDHDAYEAAMDGLLAHPKLMAPVDGGAQRQDSVRIGIESLEADAPAYVLIHDAARPFIDAPAIARVIAALQTHDGAIAALAMHDTIKRAGADALIGATVPRDDLWRAQTPQGFHFDKILSAHRAAQGAVLTDDAAVAEAAQMRVALVAGSPDNMKITQAEDFGMAEILLRRKVNEMEYRTGHGFDVHAFEDGAAVILCGVEIPHDKKLKGHSDADAGMHALHRRHSRRHRRRRYRRSLPAFRSAMERRAVSHISNQSPRPRRRTRRPHHPLRRHADLRGAKDRPVSRKNARRARRNFKN